MKGKSTNKFYATENTLNSEFEQEANHLPSGDAARDNIKF